MGNHLYWLGAAQNADPATISPGHRQLSDLAQFGFPVLPGFILDSGVLTISLRQTKTPKINWEQTKSINAASKSMMTRIKSLGLPKDLLPEVEDAYDQLLRRLDLSKSAVLIQAGLCGQSGLISYSQRVVIQRKSQLKAAIGELYANLFTAGNLTPRFIEDLTHNEFGLSLLFQPLIPVTASGLLDSTDQSIVIQAIYGRPEPLREANLRGDRYTVDRQSLAILARDLNRQEWQIMNLTDRAKHQKIQTLDQTAQKISDPEILELAKWGVSLGDHGDLLPLLEWQIDHAGRIWITAVLQLSTDLAEYNLPSEPELAQRLANGDPLAIGTAVGPVRLIKNRRDLKTLEAGEILLSETADLVASNQLETVLGQIAGWLVEAGPVKSTTVEALSEAGLPLIRQPGLAHLLPSGTLVTMDGQTGAIYRGRVKPRSHLASLPAVQAPSATKVYLKPTNLDDLTEDATLPSDGIGWLSASTLLAANGEHPRTSLNKSSRVVLNQSVDLLCQAAAAFRPRPIIYTINDLTSDQYRLLDGGEQHEKAEANPLLGYRGTHRSLREPDLLKLEFEAVRRTREDYGFDNLHLMLPFVRTMTEFTTVYHLALGSGLHPGRDFQLWLLCQVPANLLLLPELVEKQLIQGICLDLDSLTQLLLGVDHTNPKLIDEFDVRDQTVMSAIAKAIAQAREAGLPVTAVGRSLENHPDVIEALVEAGVTGLVVEAANLKAIRQVAASAEQRLILDRVLDL